MPRNGNRTGKNAPVTPSTAGSTTPPPQGPGTKAASGTPTPPPASPTGLIKVAITTLDLLKDVAVGQIVVFSTENGSRHTLIITDKRAEVTAIDGRPTLMGIEQTSDNTGANSTGKQDRWTVDRHLAVGQQFHYNRTFGVTSPVKLITVGSTK